MSGRLLQLKRSISSLTGSSIEYSLKPYLPLLYRINQLEPELASKTDNQLKEMSARLAVEAKNGADIDSLLVEAFALVREASRRVLGMRPYDVQIIGGTVIHQGKLAEMLTGEGKTLAAVMPAYLNALSGKGVHILTFNDYLASRDAGWMGPVYEFLGLSVGYIKGGKSLEERKKAYNADITYVTAKEAGFDYLRSSLCFDKNEIVQRPFFYAIIDEADSILIDEARVPLVIAGNMDAGETLSNRMREVVRPFKKGIDFDTDEYSRNIILTDKGLLKAEKNLDCENLHDPGNEAQLNALYNALHAEILLKKDIDYIIRSGKIEIVDEFTGRVVKDRHWPDGLQAAIEAKERVQPKDQGRILGSITLQHFLQVYPKISGMTATAKHSATELKDLYDLNVVEIPPNRKCIRRDRKDVIFTHKGAKFDAVINEIKKVHSTGRPVLAGTVSVKESEHLADKLKEYGLKIRVLNAKRDDLEAKIIAEAGAPGAVTISTNMAGRGTDIKLGGADEKQRDEVVALGGLLVIGTNRHESRRVDNQLRGRSGRQGDPGESRFFISLEDDLFVQFGIEKLIPTKLQPRKQNGPVNHQVFRKETARAQRIVEGQNYDIRKTLWKYSSLIESQRKTVQDRRQNIFFGKERFKFFEKRLPGRFEKFASIVDREELYNVEKLITLFHMDKCWSDHLAHIAYVKEGIHLVSLGGQIPLDEFHKTANATFRQMEKRLEKKIINSLKAVKVTKDGIDLDQEGLMGPSSTWTYLVNDDTFANSIARMFSQGGGSNSGFAIWVALLWPVFLFSLVFRKIMGRIRAKKKY